MYAHPDVIRLPLVVSRDGRLLWRLMWLAYQAEWSQRWRLDPQNLEAETETALEPIGI